MAQQWEVEAKGAVRDLDGHGLTPQAQSLIPSPAPPPATAKPQSRLFLGMSCAWATGHTPNLWSVLRQPCHKWGGKWCGRGGECRGLLCQFNDF